MYSWFIHIVACVKIFCFLILNIYNTQVYIYNIYVYIFSIYSMYVSNIYILEEEMAAHSSILVWRIPWTEEPGRLRTMGWQSQTQLNSSNRHMVNSEKRQKHATLESELPRSGGAQCTTGEEWRNSSRRKKEAEPQQKQRPALDVSGGESKV